MHLYLPKKIKSKSSLINSLINILVEKYAYDWFQSGVIKYVYMSHIINYFLMKKVEWIKNILENRTKKSKIFEEKS